MTSASLLTRNSRRPSLRRNATSTRHADANYLSGLYAEIDRRDPVAWAGRNFIIPETKEPILLAEHQKAILRFLLTRGADGRFPFTTVVYSTPKKSGKTTIAAVVSKWAAETWGPFQEVLCVGNDAAQAKERAFAAAAQSIELSPGYHFGHRVLPNRWRLLETEMTHLPTGSKLRAIATDYQGEAGANPSLTVWTELWGYIHRAALRFWAEMAPSPTRANSLRWVETYAGFEGESELLYGLYDSTVLNGRQLTAGDLGSLHAFEEAPNPDSLIPCWVNEAAGIFTYWDSGEIARRMPWQQGEHGRAYYAHEAGTQTPNQFERLHKNTWQSAESSFIPMEWWDACYKPLPLIPGDQIPVVIALDAAVTGDCFGITGVTRDPDNPTEGIVLRFARKWDPPPGGSIDYAGPEEAVRQFCLDHNVVEVAYDPYQLHDFATRLQKEGVAWFRPFDQGTARLKADKLLFDLIRDRRIKHDGNLEVREHIANANAKHSRDEDSKLRLIKKSETRHIDLAVCISMSADECLRLML